MANNDRQTEDGYRWPLRVIENGRDDPRPEQPEVFLQTLYSALETPDDREHGGQR